VPLLIDNVHGEVPFRASAVKIHITPGKQQTLLGFAPRESAGVNDSIYHRIVVLDDGDDRFYFVSSDLCYISPVEYALMAEKLQAELGINQGQFWWTATHTHSAPQVGDNLIMGMYKHAKFAAAKNEEYTTWVESRLIEGIRKAQDNLEPARIGSGWGHSPGNINRRANDVNGMVSLGRNPEKPADNRIGILRIESIHGELIALMANYAVHGTVLGSANLMISGDVQGIVSGYVESKLGAPVLLINGAAGNIAPLYNAQVAPGIDKLLHYRSLLGEKIIEASGLVTDITDDVDIETYSATFKILAKQGLPWPEEYRQYHGQDNDMEWVNLPVRFMRINHKVAVWSAPLELFCEIAIRIRNISPFPYTFYYGYTNGYLGYLLTEEEWSAGGYEYKVCPFYRSASRDLQKGVVSYLKGELLLNH
jgi:hypothetical protein